MNTVGEDPDPLASVWAAIPAKYSFSEKGRSRVETLFKKVVDDRDFENRFFRSLRSYNAGERAVRRRRAALHKAARALEVALESLPGPEAARLQSRLDDAFQSSPGIRLSLLRPTLTALISISNPVRHRPKLYDAHRLVSELTAIWNAEVGPRPIDSWAERSCFPRFARAFFSSLPERIQFSAPEVETAIRVWPGTPLAEH